MADLLEMMLSDGEVQEDAQALKKMKGGYDAYEVSLTRPSVASTFGFGYRCVQNNTGLIITVMCQGSIMEEWNKSCDLVNTICVGDRIIEINGKEEGKEMVKELKKSEEVNMKILKAGPRWHLDGATAECMRKIEWAMAKGLRFEVRAVGEENYAAADETVFDKPLCAHYGLIFLGTFLPSMALMVMFSDMFYGLWIYSALSRDIFNLMGNLVVCGTSLYALGLYVADWSEWQKAWQRYLTAGFCIYGFCFAFILKCRQFAFAPLVITLFHIVFFLGMLRATVCRNVSRSAFYQATWRCCMFSAIIILALWMAWMFSPGWDQENMYNDATKARLAADSRKIYENTMIEINGVKRQLDYVWDCPETGKSKYDFRINPTTNQREATSYMLTDDEVDMRDSRCAQVKTIWFLMWVSPLVAFMTTGIIGAFSFLNTWDYTKDASGIEKLIKGAILSVCAVLMLMWVSASVAAASMSLTQTLMAFCASAMMALMIWCYLEIGKRAITSSIKESKMMRMLIMLATSNWVRAGIIIAFNVLIPLMFVLSALNQKVRKIRQRNATDGLLTDGAEKVRKSLQHWNWGNIFIKVNLLCMVYWLFFVGVSKWTYVFLSWTNEQLLQVDLGVVIVIFFVIGFTMFLLPPVPGVPVYITAGVILGARAKTTPIGFWGGIAIGIVVSFVVKLTACSGQYLIGFCMGKSVKIQQMVGVDKTFMRGVEKILLTRGFSKAKVSVLVGGPDWPTSVICGILKLNLPQILLGTVPVIFVSSPCVLAGAFLSGPSLDANEDDGMWSTLSSTMLAASVAIQGGSMLAAAYYIQDVIGKHSAELQKYRPEHAPVMALTQKEAEAVAAWEDVLHWHMLVPHHRVLIIIASSLLLASTFLFAFVDEALHRPFQINKSIHAPIGQGGLGGNALNIVLMPGWIVNGMFVLGCITHLIFVKTQGRKAAIHLKYKQDHPEEFKKSVRHTAQRSASQQARLASQVHQRGSTVPPRAAGSQGTAGTAGTAETEK